MRRHPWTLALFLGAFFGYLVSQAILPVLASRNSSGTYSLPSGNPVVSGTTISSTWANALTSDISTEFTSSLDRSGRGAMLAALQCTNGTVSAPSLTFATDTDTGIYRVTTNDIGIAAGGVQALHCVATGCTGPVGLTLTQSTSNGTALTSTGNGSGLGANFFGGSTSGTAVGGTGGAPNGNGAVFQGDGTGGGVIATGGDTAGAHGVTGTGGSAGGAGGNFTGTLTYQGVAGTGGTTSGTGVTGTGGAPNGAGAEFQGTGTGDAVTIGAGYARFTGSNPASTTGFSSTQTPNNLIKAWAAVSTNGGSATTIVGGFNVTNPVESGNTITVDIVTDFSSSATMGCIVSGNDGAGVVYYIDRASGTVTINAVLSTTGSAINLGTATRTFTFMCMGPN